MNKLMRMMAFAGVTGLVLAACAPGGAATMPGVPVDASSATPLSITREAQVKSVELRFEPAGPVQVSAVVHGSLLESCAMLSGSQVEYANSTFQITVDVVRPTDGACQPTVTPFETTIGLNTKDLPTGAYTVIANGVSAAFTLPVATATVTTGLTQAPTQVSASPSGSAGCTDSAAFMADVSVPDNTQMAPNAPFTKTWRLKNTGTCIWDNSYLVSHISGATMTQQPAYWMVQPGQTVLPAQSVDISVGMTSPPEAGDYASYWGLKRENGRLMPIQGGANGNSFYVKIRVPGDNAGDGRVTATSIQIELEQGSGPACTANSTYFVTASITADGPTTAAYEIGSTAGQIAAGYFERTDFIGLREYVTGSLDFIKADTKRIVLRFVGPYPHPEDITVNLRVNGETWQNAQLACN